MTDQDQAETDTDAQFAETYAQYVETMVDEWRNGVKNAANAAGEWQALGDYMARLAKSPGPMLPGLPPAELGDFDGLPVHVTYHTPDFGLPENALADMFTAAMHTAYTLSGVYRRHVAQLTRALVQQSRSAASESVSADV